MSLTIEQTSDLVSDLIAQLRFLEETARTVGDDLESYPNLESADERQELLESLVGMRKALGSIPSKDNLVDSATMLAAYIEILPPLPTPETEQDWDDLDD